VTESSTDLLYKGADSGHFTFALMHYVHLEKVEGFLLQVHIEKAFYSIASLVLKISSSLAVAIAIASPPLSTD
jgi:hypothetical protein